MPEARETRPGDDVVRLGRRRRRPDARDGREPRRDGRLPGHASLSQTGRALRVLRGPRGACGDRAADLERRAVPRVPPGHVHHPVPTTSAATADARSPCTTPSCWRRGPPSPASPYPADELEHAWKLLCLNQFHDILPGSSIADVYVDTARDHAEIAAIAARVVDESLTALTPQWHAETSVVAVNPTAFAGILLAVLPAVPDGGNAFVDVRRGAELPTQSVDGGTLVELDAAGIRGRRDRPTRLTGRWRCFARRYRSSQRSRRRLRVGERDPASRVVR